MYGIEIHRIPESVQIVLRKYDISTTMIIVITQSEVVELQGVLIDNQLIFSQHINKITQKTAFKFNALR